jgi:hypothetical protein
MSVLYLHIVQAAMVYTLMIQDVLAEPVRPPSRPPTTAA